MRRKKGKNQRNEKEERLTRRIWRERKGYRVEGRVIELSQEKE